MIGYEVVIRRIGGGAFEMIGATAQHEAMAHLAGLVLVNQYRAEGFTGKRNAAGVWRLSKRDGGRRVRLAVYVRPVAAPVCLN